VIWQSRVLELGGILFHFDLVCSPHVFLTNGLATSGSRVALVRAQAATLVVGATLSAILDTHPSLTAMRGSYATPDLRPSNEDGARHVCSATSGERAVAR
jgi:hypothetical protein